MALTTDQIQQCKYFLNYGNLTASARPYFDIALVFEDVVAQNVTAGWATTYLTGTILPNLLTMEANIMACRLRMVAVSANKVVLNPKELDDLESVYDFWLCRLESFLKIKRAPKHGTADVRSGGDCTVTVT